MTEKRLKRFWDKVNIGTPEECWEWTAYVTDNGYGKTSINHRQWYAHRFSYFLHNDDFDSNLLVRHLCHNKKCVNPLHLKQGTHADNMNDEVVSGRKRRGESCSHAKLTEEQVLEIRDRYSIGETTQQCLADEHGVTHQCIHSIITRKSWTHI